MMSGKNILYLFESAVGIGHQRRASGIINGLVLAGFNVYVASGTFIEPENYFDPRANLIMLPEPRRKKDSVMSYYNKDNQLVIDPDYNLKDWNDARIKAIQPFVEKNEINAVFAEWWPFQRRRDFDQIIDYIIEMQQNRFGKKPMIISSLRDVIETDNKEIFNVNGEKEKTTVEVINSCVDLILVHGDQNFVPLEHGVDDHSFIKKPIIYTGYVVNENAKVPVGHERNKTILVSCGSGHEGHHMMNAALQAMSLSKMTDHEWHYVLGPRMQPLERDEFHNTAREIRHKKPELKIVIHDQLAELPKSLSRAGLSVSLAGYNTTMEVLASHVPSVLVPKFIENFGEITKIEGEQWERLVLMRDRKMANIAHPEDVVNPQKFAGIIDKAFTTGTPETKLNMNGIHYTAELMTKLFPAEPQNATETQQVYTFNHEKHTISNRIAAVFSSVRMG